MKTIKQIFIYGVGVPVGIALFLVIGGMTTLLWPILIVLFLIDLLVRKAFSKKETVSKCVSNFEETIFALYGFALLWLLLPFSLSD